MAEKLIDVENYRGILEICLNTPQNLNALNLELGDELLALLEEARNDTTVKAVIFSGAGRAFCAGGDLQFVLNWKGSKREAFGLLTHRLNRIVMDLRTMPKPAIAAVNGVASGAGFSLAMACDLRVASTKAMFKQAYTSVGLVPDGGWTVSVARQVGAAKASELLLLDPVITAEEALNWGLVNYVVSPDSLMEKARELAEIVLSKSLQAFARSKELVNRSLWTGFTEQLELERNGIMAAGESSDFAEGVRAFMEKREPRFNRD